ncbi:Ferredoxin-NADP reductase [Marinobacter daqiaonensis]|uniref:Ferredoxin-NADP reductase n=1 Tax=Marinobacter daqiaonensis TaxID=650891 RepID=A0A1I6HHI0_9GAMM|nr:FAD-binding oxidoreductase [Marinobacter daqiaonensis]SFR53760.1 Ferredoxin-NADP reductase [Marinobacter daqiaonensis]
MAADSDITRTRQSARQSLVELEDLSRRQRECGDQQLRSTLAGINRRKSAQTWRLLEWLRRQETGAGAGAEAPPLTGGSDPASADDGNGEAAPAPEAEPGPSQTGALTRPATTAEGVAVMERRDVTPDLIIFRVPRPQDFQFVAGQSVKVGLGGITRSYSIVSAPHEPFLEFFVELVPGGRMSEKMRQMRAGDPVTLGTPKGGLRFDESYPHQLMVATVTGINPFVSMLRDYLHRGKSGHHFHLLHGASYQREYGYREELEALAAAHPDLLTYVPTVSRPEEAANQGWTGATGRVDTLVEEYLSRHNLTSGNTLIYACGHSGMLAAVGQYVAPLEFQLKTESYD